MIDSLAAVQVFAISTPRRDTMMPIVSAGETATDPRATAATNATASATNPIAASTNGRRRTTRGATTPACVPIVSLRAVIALLEA
jgi:hypothetical protein